jgi:dTDP-4-dehydrorhamnose reductase
MKILLFGAAGQLGMDIQRVLKKDFSMTALSHAQCDLTDARQVDQVVSDQKPDTVINAAAMTDVPKCETQDTKSFAINGLAAKYVAQACNKMSCKLLHISTDYVFDGKKNEPYVESDLPRPLNVYGLSKLTGEYYIQANHDKFFIVRTSGLYGIHECRGKKTNFVETMLRLAKERDVIKVVDDEILTPTFTLHLAQQIKILIASEEYGIYHATNNGSCSWYAFTKKIFELAKINTTLHKTDAKTFGGSVRRPAYSVLKNRNLQNHGIDLMAPWDEALADYFKDRENKLKI